MCPCNTFPTENLSSFFTFMSFWPCNIYFLLWQVFHKERKYRVSMTWEGSKWWLWLKFYFYQVFVSFLVWAWSDSLHFWRLFLRPVLSFAASGVCYPGRGQSLGSPLQWEQHVGPQQLLLLCRDCHHHYR